ncbi:MAG: hypothetical protein ACC656_00305 [Candidatus Heimdallarchaeota archaeon]
MKFRIWLFLVIAIFVSPVFATYNSNDNHFEYQILHFNQISYDSELYIDIPNYIKSGDKIIWKFKEGIKGDRGMSSTNVLQILVNDEVVVNQDFGRLWVVFNKIIFLSAKMDDGSNTFSYWSNKFNGWNVTGDKAYYNEIIKDDRSELRIYDKGSGILEYFETKDLGGELDQELILKKIDSYQNILYNPIFFILSLILMITLWSFVWYKLVNRASNDLPNYDDEITNHMTMEWADILAPITFNRKRIKKLQNLNDTTLIGFFILVIVELISIIYGIKGFTIELTFSTNGYQPLIINHVLLPLYLIFGISFFMSAMIKKHDPNINPIKIFRVYGLASYWTLLSGLLPFIISEFSEFWMVVYFSLFSVLFVGTIAVALSPNNEWRSYLRIAVYLILSATLLFIISIPVLMILTGVI